MSVGRMIGFPIANLLVFLYLWYSARVTGKNALIYGGLVSFVYLLVELYRYGILFTSAKFQEISWPSFTFYYKEYDCDYNDIRGKLLKDLSDSDLNMLKSRPSVNYMEIYQERVSSDKAQEAGHASGGFALRLDAENDIGISKVLEALHFKKRVFTECPAVVGSMKKVDNLSRRIVIGKMAGQIWDYVENKKKTEGVLFMWEEKKTVSCGAFLGPKNTQYKVKGFVHEPNAQSEMVSGDYRKIKKAK